MPFYPAISASYRHQLLIVLNLVLILVGFNRLATAQPTSPTASSTALLAQPGYYRLRVGAITVTALSDGTLPLTHNFFTHTTPGEIDELLHQALLPYPIETSVNAYLLELDAHLVLVDTGAGDLMGPTLGQLPVSLRAAGYQPAQVTDILLTHIHGDHSGGLTVDGRQVFPNATVHVGQAERDYWLSATNLTRAPTDGKVPALDRRLFLEAHTKLDPYVAANRVQTFADGAEVVPGIRAVVEPGHTPGHTCYVLNSEGRTLVFGGDAVHAALQFARPNITFIGDVDPVAAEAVSRQVFANAARQQYWVAFAHISFPGVGHLHAKGQGYEWWPLNYSTTGQGQ